MLPPGIIGKLRKLEAQALDNPQVSHWNWLGARTIYKLSPYTYKIL